MNTDYKLHLLLRKLEQIRDDKDIWDNIEFTRNNDGYITQIIEKNTKTLRQRIINLTRDANNDISNIDISYLNEG